MREMVFAAAAVFFSATTVFAADGLASCEKLKRQSDRNVCITETIRAQANAQVPTVTTAPALSEQESALLRAKDMFDAVDSLRSVVNSGVSYEQYGPYVQALAIQLDKFKAAAQLPGETEAATLVSEALQAYQDARNYWWKDIDFYSNWRNRESYAFALPIGLAGTGELVQRYQLPSRNADLLGFHRGVERGIALGTIWKVASTKSDLAKTAIGSIGAPKQVSTVTATQVAAPSPDMRKLIDAALLKAGCFTTGELMQEPELNERAIYWTQCTHSGRQTVSCSPTSCVALDGG